MKRMLMVVLAATVLSSSMGCCLIDRMFMVRRCYPLGDNGACQAHCSECGAAAGACRCGWAHGGLAGRAAARRSAGAYADGYMAGNSHGAVAYPYYTNRGPRDFLAKNPRDIGP